MKLDQPWYLATPKVIKEVKIIDQSSKHYLVSNFSYSKGLGNLMFQYASLRSLADRRQATLLLPLSTTLRRAFNLDATFVTDEVADELLRRAANATFETKSCCAFVPIPKAAHQIAAVTGYLQNPRYFSPENDFLIRKEFAFLPAVQEQALSFLRALAARRALERARPIYNKNPKSGDDAFEMETDALLDDLFYIGVHVRRGMDIEMNGRNIEHGHQAAPADYYKKAMEFAKGDREKVIFVVCSDNPSWAKKNLPSYDKGMIFFCPGVHREVDMAILAQCDALVLSTGTFSWWSGFLNQKSSQIIYYDGWPRPGSDLMKMVNKTEYFPSTWTPLS